MTHAGVASGDPFAKSVILWTRVSPASNRQGRPAAVDWAVSRTRNFQKIVSRGTTFTSSDVDFTVKVNTYPVFHLVHLLPFTCSSHAFRNGDNEPRTCRYMYS